MIDLSTDRKNIKINKDNRIRVTDEDGEPQEYTVKGYRVLAEMDSIPASDMMMFYECKIVVRDTVKTVDRKLSANIEELKAKGYPITCKIFEDMGHGGLIGENTERFIEEVNAVHRQSMKE